MKKIIPVDIITLIFLCFNLLFIIIGWERIDDPTLHFSIYFGITVIALLLIKNAPINGNSKFVNFIRTWYPMFFFPYFFTATSALNRVVFTDYIDHFFQNIDKVIFGYQPALEWANMFDGLILSELFHFAYFAYYPMIYGFAIYLFIKNRKQFMHYIFVLSFVFYICYLTFNFLPVIGGRWWEIMEGYPFVTTEYRYGIFTHIMVFIYRNTTHLGGAFPSSHVAIAIVITIEALRSVKKIGLIFLPITFILALSTVYCGYHYFIDTVFGVFYGIAFYYLGDYCYKKLKKKYV